MKKIISVLMIAVMLVSIFTVVAFADEHFDTSQFKYYNKVVEHYFELKPSRYDELYYHYSDENSEEPEWTLIYCPYNPEPIDGRYGTIVGDRVFSLVGPGTFSVSGHSVYIRKTDDIIDLDENNLERIIELCPDFVQALEENEIGQAFGDVDNDKKLTVMDATCIQMHLAGYSELSHYDYVAIGGGRMYVFISDFDRDGERTILDATAIQMKLAKLS